MNLNLNLNFNKFKFQLKLEFKFERRSQRNLKLLPKYFSVSHQKSEVPKILFYIKFRIDTCAFAGEGGIGTKRGEPGIGRVTFEEITPTASVGGVHLNVTKDQSMVQRVVGVSVVQTRGVERVWLHNVSISP